MSTCCAVWLLPGGHQAPSAAGRPLGVTCAEELAAVWAAVAARVDEFGRYCGHLLADYLVLAAIPLPPAGDDFPRTVTYHAHKSW